MKVVPIKSEETYPWLLEKHYAKRIPQIVFAFGLYDYDILVGVCTYGYPPSKNLCYGICGQEFTDHVLELNRLCLVDNAKNQASFLVANSIRLLPKPTIVVSYADIDKGHVGYVYQATNFIYTGLSAIRKDVKIRGMEHLHSRTLTHQITASEMRQKYGDDVFTVDRPRKHRYVYFHGNKSQKKTMLKALKYPVEKYPKGDSRKYESGGVVPTQNLLFM